MQPFYAGPRCADSPKLEYSILYIRQSLLQLPEFNTNKLKFWSKFLIILFLRLFIPEFGLILSCF